VAGIAAIRHIGTKVGFSNLGRAIAISAPGGNCVNTGDTDPCLYSIDTTSNDGTTTPGTNTYTDRFHRNVGTSFSAPIVAGIAALMAAVNSRLDSAQLIRRLQSGAKPFPKDTSLPDCHVPTSAADLQTAECNCTTDTCGAGMANARGAVSEALRPVAVATASPTTAASGDTVSLHGSGSFAANGRSITTYAWTVVESSGPAPVIANADTQNASFTTTNDGEVTLRLTVTDDQGAQDSAEVSINEPAPAIEVTVSPSIASVTAGSGTQAFTATVTNTSNTAVTWQVNGVTGGNATVGTVSSSGLYAAPATVPSPSTVTVSAISNADNAISDSAQVTITPASNKGGGGGGGGGGGAIDTASLLTCLMTLVFRRARSEK
jgi:serine protease